MSLGPDAIAAALAAVAEHLIRARRYASKGEADEDWVLRVLATLGAELAEGPEAFALRATAKGREAWSAKARREFTERVRDVLMDLDEQATLGRGWGDDTHRLRLMARAAGLRAFLDELTAESAAAEPSLSVGGER